MVENGLHKVFIFPQKHVVGFLTLEASQGGNSNKYPGQLPVSSERMCTSTG